MKGGHIEEFQNKRRLSYLMVSSIILRVFLYCFRLDGTLWIPN